MMTPYPIAYISLTVSLRNIHFSNRPKPGSPEALALAVFDLQAPVSLTDIKDRYKALVKRHHPDANGGDKGAEEKFKQVSQAYQTLMAEITE